ncbi:MAG: tyrosine protein kinase, partial [Flavobacterium sp.]|nr:tyrosine protein kinase [Flavobacterium sp.]
MIIFVVGAHLYIRYSVPMYRANTSLIVKDDRKGSIASELGAFSDLGMFNGVKSNVDNEIEILKSRTLVRTTVEDLQLSIS